jgi:hypothetical protein
MASTSSPASASTELDLPGCREATVHRNDDESSAAVELPFEVDFYGNTYDGLYVNNNGNVTFDSPLGDYVPFDLTQTNRVIIAPFFADVDTRPSDGGTVTYGQTTFNGRPAFCVIWDEVGYFPNQTDLRNSFQLLLVRGTPGTGDFDVVFRYDTVQWELGSASGGVSARAGFSNGEPAKSVELAGSAVNGAFLDWGPQALSQSSLESPDPGTWIFHIRSGTAGNDPRNVPAGFDRSTLWWDWPDGDGDGLPDNWERNGVWVGDTHVDLAARGADPNRKDAFVYVDVVAGERWNPTIESMLRSSFRNSPLDIDLHIVRGARTLARSEVPAAVTASDSFFSQMVRRGFTDTGLSGTPGSVPALAKYVCACPDYFGNTGVGGEANGIKADHLIVTVYEAKWLAAIRQETGISFANDDLVGDRLNAITTMHELGHLYGLRHHGAQHQPVEDPAYRSIMSYAYNAFGVPRPASEAIATGDLLPRIDYSRENSVNFDWRPGGGFGQLSLVYGQHGERGSFYTTVDDIPAGAEEAPVEAGIDELLANPSIRAQIARGAREVAAALNGSGPTPAGPAAGGPKGGLEIKGVQLKRRAAIVSLSCGAPLPCAGKLSLGVKGSGDRSRPKGSRSMARQIVIGQSSFSLPAGSAQALKMKLSPTGIERVRLAGKQAIKMTVSATGLPPRTMRLKLATR